MRKKTISDEDIVARVQSGNPDSGYMAKMADADRRLSSQFRFPGETGVMVEDDQGNWTYEGLSEETSPPMTRVAGVSTQFQTNIYTKVAAIAINEPDWHVEVSPAADSTVAPIIRAYLRDLWRRWGWRRVTQKALLKRYISGIGIVAYRWDAIDGVQLDHVHSWDFACDMRDGNWNRLQWAARRIRMSKRDAYEWFKDDEFKYDEDENPDTQRLPIWVYWDQSVEAVIYNDRVIRRSANLYGRLPVIFLLGDLDVGASPYPIGDLQLAAGHVKELEDLTAMLSNIARNGRAINVVTEQMLSKNFEETIRDGLELGWVAVKDLSTQSYMRVPSEDVSTALMQAIEMSRTELDTATGVTGVQRGVPSGNFRFATEAALVANQSGARAVQARVEFESFVEDIARAVIDATVRFGGVVTNEAGEIISSEEDQILWEAAREVTDIRVVEGSSLYRDPAQDQQQAMQLFNLMSQTMPVFVQLGLPIPNLQRFAEDLLRAFGRRNTNEYWIAPPAGAGAGAPPEEGVEAGGGALPPV